MKEIELATWEELDEQLASLADLRATRTAAHPYVSEYLYRGQANSAWGLETTLERFAPLTPLPTLVDYYHTLYRTRPEVSTFTATEWGHLPDLTDYERQLGGEPRLPLACFPGYDYFVYLRHHGFPSPLLDWSRSPYVAAYFAFRDIGSSATKASIYAYCEFTEGHKSGSGNAPEITGLGKYVRSHRRHFQQQSQYTICTNCRDGMLAYARHQDAFARNDEGQDELIKFSIPTTERTKALRNLDQHNINAFSLFGSEDSLMETVAIREMLLRRR